MIFRWAALELCWKTKENYSGRTSWMNRMKKERYERELWSVLRMHGQQVWAILVLVHTQECPCVFWCESGFQECVTWYDCISDAFSVTFKPTPHRSPTSLRKPTLLLLFDLGFLCYKVALLSYNLRNYSEDGQCGVPQKLRCLANGLRFSSCTFCTVFNHMGISLLVDPTADLDILT